MSVLLLLDHRNGVNLVKQMRLISVIRLHRFITVIFFNRCDTIEIDGKLKQKLHPLTRWPLYTHTYHQTTKQTCLILFHFGGSHWRIG